MFLCLLYCFLVCGLHVYSNWFWCFTFFLFVNGLNIIFWPRNPKQKWCRKHSKTPDSNTGKRKETQTASGTISKVKHILPTRSEVWKHYTRTKEDRDKCVCNYCQTTFSCLTNSWTSNLKSHLQKCKSHFALSAGQEDKQPNNDDEGKLKKAKLTEGQLR